MVTICSKNFCRPTIQDIMLAKIRKKKENESIEEFFQRMKQQREGGNSKVLSGTTVPNSTFKSLLGGNSQGNNSLSSVREKSDKPKSSSSITSKQSGVTSLKSIKINSQGKEGSSATVIKPEERNYRSSMLSGTSTLEELKELRDLLHKSSYIAKKTKTRRPTIEKIRSAIEREKQSLNNKNENTTNASAEFSDASTETEKKKKKRGTGKKPLNSVKKGSSTSRSVNTAGSTIQVGKKGKNIKRKKKINTKIDVEIQCSIFKVETKD